MTTAISPDKKKNVVCRHFFPSCLHTLIFHFSSIFLPFSSSSAVFLLFSNFNTSFKCPLFYFFPFSYPGPLKTCDCTHCSCWQWQRAYMEIEKRLLVLIFAVSQEEPSPGWGRSIRNRRFPTPYFSIPFCSPHDLEM